MVGECTGKVRSTPTPKLTLRTVKVSRTPSPWRRITTPWKIWTRSRVPSTTRTCTLTVSPGRNSGTSSRRLSRSMISVGCMGRVLLVQMGWAGTNIVAVVGQHLHLARRLEHRHLVGTQPAPGRHQVRAPAEGVDQGLGPPPPL